MANPLLDDDPLGYIVKLKKNKIGTYIFLCLEWMLQYCGVPIISEIVCDGPIKEAPYNKLKNAKLGGCQGTP